MTAYLDFDFANNCWLTIDEDGRQVSFNLQYYRKKQREDVYQPLMVVIDGKKRYVDGFEFTKREVVGSGIEKKCISIATPNEDRPLVILKHKVRDLDELKMAEREYVRQKRLCKHSGIAEMLRAYRIPSRKNPDILKIVMIAPQALGDADSLNKKFSLEDKWRMFIQVGRAIEYLHERNFTHGDIKGTNVLVTKDKRYHFHLSDFSGLYREGDKPYQLFHTKGFSAPEIYQEDFKYPTPAFDIYSFGILILKTLSSDNQSAQTRLEKRGLTDIEIKKRYASESEYLRSDLPRSPIYDLVYTMLREDPTRRPNISKVLDKLYELKDEAIKRESSFKRSRGEKISQS